MQIQVFLGFPVDSCPLWALSFGLGLGTPLWPAVDSWLPDGERLTSIEVSRGRLRALAARSGSEVRVGAIDASAAFKKALLFQQYIHPENLTQVLSGFFRNLRIQVRLFI